MRSPSLAVIAARAAVLGRCRASEVFIPPSTGLIFSNALNFRVYLRQTLSWPRFVGDASITALAIVLVLLLLLLLALVSVSVSVLGCETSSLFGFPKWQSSTCPRT